MQPRGSTNVLYWHSQGYSIKFHTGRMACVVAVSREGMGKEVGSRKSERKQGDFPIHRLPCTPSPSVPRLRLPGRLIQGRLDGSTRNTVRIPMLTEIQTVSPLFSIVVSSFMPQTETSF